MNGDIYNKMIETLVQTVITICEKETATYHELMAAANFAQVVVKAKIIQTQSGFLA